MITYRRIPLIWRKYIDSFWDTSLGQLVCEIASVHGFNLACINIAGMGCGPNLALMAWFQGQVIRSRQCQIIVKGSLECIISGCRGNGQTSCKLEQSYIPMSQFWVLFFTPIETPRDSPVFQIRFVHFSRPTPTILVHQLYESRFTYTKNMWLCIYALYGYAGVRRNKNTQFLICTGPLSLVICVLSLNAYILVSHKDLFAKELAALIWLGNVLWVDHGSFRLFTEDTGGIVHACIR